jgi:hypothetical protein
MDIHEVKHQLLNFFDYIIFEIGIDKSITL